MSVFHHVVGRGFDSLSRVIGIVQLARTTTLDAQVRFLLPSNRDSSVGQSAGLLIQLIDLKSISKKWSLLKRTDLKTVLSRSVLWLLAIVEQFKKGFEVWGYRLRNSHHFLLKKMDDETQKLSWPFYQIDEN